MKKNLKYFAAIMKEDIQKDSPRDTNIQKFHDMLNCVWESGTDLHDLPWWKDVVNSAPADSMDSAIRTFSNILPSLRIFPNNPQEAAKHRAETIEDGLMWHFNKANQRGTRRPLEKIVESVAKVGGVGMQVRYLPFDFKGRMSDPRVKAILRGGDFSYRVHPFESVHARWSDEALESVTLAKMMSVADLKREFGEDNPGVKAIIEEIGEKNQNTLEKTMVNYYQFDDYENVVKMCSFSGGGSLNKEVGGNLHEILRDKNELPFLQWIYKESQKPMLQTLVDSKSWEHQNEMESIQRSIALSVAAHPAYWSKTMGKTGVEVDFTEPGGQAKLGLGEEMGAVPERRADPELMRAAKEGEQKLSQQLNTRALQYATEIASSAPFATFNAIMETTIASLSLMTKVAESALEEVFYQELSWIKYSKKTLTGQRLRTRDTQDPAMMKGSIVTIGTPVAETDTITVDYDPDELNIQVKLNPDTPTDRQSRQTQAVWYHDRLGMAWEDALEAAGLTDIERDENNWMLEQLTQATIRKEAALIEGEAQVKIQQAMTQIQMQAQQAQQQQALQAQQQASGQGQPQSMQNEQMALNQGGAFEMAQGQSPNNGGQPAAVAAPGMTRERGTGRAQSHVQENL